MPRTETIRLRAQRALDQFNDPTGPASAWRTVTGAIVVPRTSEDYEQRGTVVIKGFMIVVPSSVAVEDTDEIEVRGEVYRVDGAVGDYGRRKIFNVFRVN